jgi:hypothetical protein
MKLDRTRPVQAGQFRTLALTQDRSGHGALR